MILLYFKAAHIVSFVAWFAGLFYLPRLMVYHANLPHTSDTYALFCLMEYRLYRWIMVPAMLSTLLFGLLLFFKMGGWPYYKGQAWMHAKLGLLTLLIGYHHYLGALVRQFKTYQQRHSHRYYRFINEVPTVFLVLITILVVCRPF